MLWLLIRSTSNEYHNICFREELKKNINLFFWLKTKQNNNKKQQQTNKTKQQQKKKKNA